jgi:hypothetical protein
MSLSTGQIIEDYELLKPLNERSLTSWLAHNASGRQSVLRFLSYLGMSRNKAPVDTNLQIEGYLPFQSMTYLQLGKIHYWMLQRPYFSKRLSDEIAPNPSPSRHLLHHLGAFAEIFDRLEAAVPDMSFDLSSGNLLLDDDKPLVVDIGLAPYTHYSDGEMRFPVSSYIEQERQVPLTAAYPSIYSYPFLGTGTAYSNTIQRTDAQFAIAAFYVWLKTRFLIFEDPQNPYPTPAQLPLPIQSPVFMTILQWMQTIWKRVRAYEERGHLDLLMITEPKERAILLKALHRDRTQAYASAVAFIEALQANV